MGMLVYNLVFPLLFVLYLPFYLIHLLRRGGLDRQFWERLGFFSREKKRRLAGLAKPVWIHAVSVGEVVAAAGFIATWRGREPGMDFVLSTTTTTGYAIAQKKMPAGVVPIYCPIDFFCLVRRVFRLVNPRMLIVFEVEFWPNLITRAARRQIPVILVNGRLSDTSAAGYARHAWFFRPLFSRFSRFCMQSEADVARIRRVVGEAVPAVACNTMKFDQVADPTAADKAALFACVFGAGEHLVLTAGSTHANEEALIADVFNELKGEFPALKLVLVPRHHERSPEVERILKERRLAYRRLLDAEACEAPVDVLLVDTTGELMGFYGASAIVYVGKSLAGCTGGHNIIEPAIFGKPIIHGANLQNFRLVARLFAAAGATVVVADDAGLAPALRKLCASRALREELSLKSRRVVEQGRGAMERTLEAIDKLRETFRQGDGHAS